MFLKLKSYFIDDIWNFSIDDKKGFFSFLIKCARIVFLSVHGFIKDKCSLQAASLTYYSLMAIVPCFALLFGISKGFGFQAYIENELLEKFPDQRIVLLEIIKFANNLLENTKGGLIAGIGVLVLFWSVIKLLSKMEFTFNKIWGGSLAKSWKRRFADYLSLFMVVPFFLVISGSVKVLVFRNFKLIIENLPYSFLFNHAFIVFAKMFPFILMSLLLIFIYIFIPNAKVKFFSALIGGFIAASLYEILQWLYLFFQIGVSKYGAIYGSFAALPLFLIWLQLSWVVILFGVEITYSLQHQKKYEFWRFNSKMSLNTQMTLCIWVLCHIAKRMLQRKDPFSKRRLSKELNIPFGSIDKIINTLVSINYVSEIKRKRKRDIVIQLNISPEDLTILQIVEDINSRGYNTIPFETDDVNKKIQMLISKFYMDAKQSSLNCKLKDLFK